MFQLIPTPIIYILIILAISLVYLYVVSHGHKGGSFPKFKSPPPPASKRMYPNNIPEHRNPPTPPPAKAEQPAPHLGDLIQIVRMEQEKDMFIAELLFLLDSEDKEGKVIMLKHSFPEAREILEKINLLKSIASKV